MSILSQLDPSAIGIIPSQNDIEFSLANSGIDESLADIRTPAGET
jgi:hypothetical protein